MSLNVIIQENCPVCLEAICRESLPCFAHAPSETSHVHALCMECFDLIRAQNQVNTIQCPLCRAIVPFTEGRVGDVIAVDRPQVAGGLPRRVAGGLDGLFTRSIEQRDYFQVRSHLLNPSLSEETIQISFRDAIEQGNEEIANLIYSSRRLENEFLDLLHAEYMNALNEEYPHTYETIVFFRQTIMR